MIAGQTEEITAHMLEAMKEKIKALDSGIPALPDVEEIPALHA